MIQIIENNTLHNLEVTMNDIVRALEFLNKERQRQRDKAKRLYWAKKAKIDEPQNPDPALNIPPVPSSPVVRA